VRRSADDIVKILFFCSFMPKLRNPRVKLPQLAEKHVMIPSLDRHANIPTLTSQFLMTHTAALSVHVRFYICAAGGNALREVDVPCGVVLIRQVNPFFDRALFDRWCQSQKPNHPVLHQSNRFEVLAGGVPLT
jgi:hypothetical protein